MSRRPPSESGQSGRTRVQTFLLSAPALSTRHNALFPFIFLSFVLIWYLICGNLKILVGIYAPVKLELNSIIKETGN